MFHEEKTTEFPTIFLVYELLRVVTHKTEPVTFSKIDLVFSFRCVNYLDTCAKRVKQWFGDERFQDLKWIKVMVRVCRCGHHVHVQH